LQKRLGTICASTGCPVVASALATILYSRIFRPAVLSRPRRVDLRGMAIDSIETYEAFDARNERDKEV
jgi:hypothetical protein